MLQMREKREHKERKRKREHKNKSSTIVLRNYENIDEKNKNYFRKRPIEEVKEKEIKTQHTPTHYIMSSKGFLLFSAEKKVGALDALKRKQIEKCSHSFYAHK